MKRILVPIDFSKHSEEALKVAAQIAKKNNSEVILLHVLELPNYPEDGYKGGFAVPQIIAFKENAISRLEKLMDADYLKGIKLLEAIDIKGVCEGIIESSNINNVDLIVMGSEGASGLKELLVGSNAEKVVRLSNIPVLIIKNKAEEFKSKKFVFASDFSEETREPFRKAIEFAKIFDSDIFLVMICSPNNFKTTHEAEKIMSDFTAKLNIKNHTTHIYNDRNTEAGVVNFSNSVNADLIGICNDEKTGLSLFFNNSVSENLANHVHKPIITFKK